MKSLIIPSVALLGLASLSACVIHIPGHFGGSSYTHSSGPRRVGNGVQGDEMRDVSDFHGVSMEGFVGARIRMGEETSVKVSCDDNLLRHITTKVRNGVLEVRLEDGNYEFDHAPRVIITTPHIDALSLSGASNVELRGLNENELSIAISGMGEVDATGSVDRLTISIDGSGDVDCEDVRSADVSISISGIGDVSVSAKDTLAITIAGYGDVNYSGNPRVTKSISGLGDVSRID